ncbi:MAG: hypothetical protein K9M08_21275, partial [Pirellula sp.]|nr:hypothetical protein [Pirellula sp.]
SPLSDQHPTGINPDVMAGALRSECWLRLTSDGDKPRRNEQRLKARLRTDGHHAAGWRDSKCLGLVLGICYALWLIEAGARRTVRPC